jgi:hypothetical protein
VSASLAAVELEFAGQLLHGALPGAFLNVPAAQALHARPSDPV